MALNPLIANNELGACRTWGVDGENRPQRGQFLPDSKAHSPAMGQEAGEKWAAAVDLQPTHPKSDRLLDTAAESPGALLAQAGAGDDAKVSLGQHLSDNLRAVMAVAGKQRDNGSPGPVTDVRIHRITGVARSTLRAIKSPAGGHAVNPDLKTLERLADALDVPPAFLLMRPQDWLALGKAVEGMGDFWVAAMKLQHEGQLEPPQAIEKVLRECKVHPDARPLGVGASPEVKRVNARDEWRRRSSLKFGALMLRPVRGHAQRAVLAAVAAALVSRATPHAPELDD